MATLRLATVRVKNKSVFFTFPTAAEAQAKARELMENSNRHEISCRWEIHQTVDIQNGQTIEDGHDECPVHWTPIKKEYLFGVFESPIIKTYSCGCCTLSQAWACTKYYNNWKDAHSEAMYRKAVKNAKKI